MEFIVLSALLIHPRKVLQVYLQTYIHSLIMLDGFWAHVLIGLLCATCSRRI